jgi:hypothetical protein
MRERTLTNSNTETEDSASDSQPRQKNEWTLMFHIAGDAGLSASMISQLKELTDAGYQKDTTVLAYFDPNCNGRNARIFDVNHLRKTYSDDKTDIGDGIDPYVRNIAEDCYIQGLPQIPAALTLRYFLEYSRVYYPAKNYMVFLMGHGVIVGNDAFLPDADDDSAITLSDLGRILARFGEKVRAEESEFHLVGFHSCSMNSVELVHQLAGTARYMLGTQGMAFPGSWPYRQLLKKIFCAIERDKNLTTPPSNEYPNELVKEILRGLQDLSFYNSEDFWLAGYSSDISMCCLDKDKIQKLDEPLRELTSALKKALKDDSAKKGILLAHWESQSYWGENYTDLYDFCERLQKLNGRDSENQAAVWDACKGVREVLESDPKMIEGDPAGNFDRLVVFSDFYGPSYQYSNGLSIFFPWARPDEKTIRAYENYAFTKQSESNSWLSFLEAYFLDTRRDARSWKGGFKPETTGTSEGSSEPPKTASLGDSAEGSQGPPKTGSLGDSTGGSLGPPKTGSLGDSAGGSLGPPKTGALGDSTGGSLGPPKTGALGLLHDLGLVSEVDWLDILSDEALLWLPYLSGNEEARRLFWTAFGPSKPGGGLGPPKPGGGLGPPKPGGGLGPPKPGGGLGPPKPGGGLGPPKPGGLGLFGLTVIKNFHAPEEVFITSRPGGNPGNRRRRNSARGSTPQRNRPPTR